MARIAGRGRPERDGTCVRSLFLAISFVTWLACPSAGREDVETSKRVGDLVSLQDSREPLEKHFNEHRQARRFLALLSPT